MSVAAIATHAAFLAILAFHTAQNSAVDQRRNRNRPVRGRSRDASPTHRRRKAQGKRAVPPAENIPRERTLLSAGKLMQSMCTFHRCIMCIAVIDAKNRSIVV